jgi:hypothetical protein
MDLLANLEKILLSPEIGESYFQKAEGGYPHPPRSRRRCTNPPFCFDYFFSIL